NLLPFSAQTLCDFMAISSFSHRRHRGRLAKTHRPCIASGGERLWVAVLAALELAECLVVALEGRLTSPVAGLGVVVFYALADGVKVAKLELGLRVAVIGRLAIPRCGLRVAQGNPLAGVVEIGQLLLG